MRTIAMALVLMAGCSLDVSSKPECLVDDDCRYPAGHCYDQVCVRNVAPMGHADVLYVNPTNLPLTLTADVTANDVDPEGDTIQIVEVRRDDAASGSIAATNVTQVKLDVTQLPSTFSYRVRDDLLTFDVNAWIPITVARLDSSVTLRVEAGTTAPLMPVLGSIVDLDAVELLTPPTVGTLQGTLPAVTYVPPADYCGTDAVTYRVRGTNGTIDVTITFEVGILLADDQRSIEFGSPTTVDVLANDRAGLELVSTTDAFAAVPTTKDVLVVSPPTTGANTYRVDYIARDSRGCEGTATLTLDVGFPTRVVVGEGLTGDAFDATLSSDGRYLAFTSADATLVSGDTNAAADVFVRDLATNVIERVSVASDGAQANETSGSPTISADGRWVAFTSRATTLVAADTTSIEDIYLHDRTTGATTLVSISIDGGGSDHASLTPHISADGNRITFASNATRLVANDTNDVMDVFVRDVSGATTLRVSQTSSGAQVPYASEVRPRISGNGRYVALSSTSSLDGSNQSGAFLVDTTGMAISRIGGSTGEVDLDDAGRFVVHAAFNVTLLDRVVENATSLGMGAYPAISADGKFVAFVNGKQIFARGTGASLDVIVNRAGTVVQVTPLRRPEMSGDGRWIVFSTSEWPGSEGRFVIVRVWNRAHG